MMFQGRICEYSSGTDFHEITAEFVFQHAIFEPAEVNGVAQAERVQVVAARVLAVITNATLTLNAAVHLVIDQRSEILIPEGSFAKRVMAGAVAGHYRHILQMTLPSFVAHRTVMRMVLHEPLNHRLAKFGGFRVFYRHTGTVSGRRHARHDDFARCVLLVAELLYSALTACSHRSERRMPTEIGKIVAPGQEHM